MRDKNALEKCLIFYVCKNIYSMPRRLLTLFDALYDIADIFKHKTRSLWEVCYLSARGNAGQHKHRIETRLDPGDNIRIHTVSNDRRIL